MLEHGVSEFSDNVIQSSAVASGIARDGVPSGLQIKETSNYKDFAADVDLLDYLRGLAEQLTLQGKGVGVGRVIKGTVDLAKAVEDDEGSTLYDMCVGIYPELDDYPTAALYRYLSRISPCYVEIPSHKVREGVTSPTFTKFVTTGNIDIVRAWSETPVRDTAAAKLDTVDDLLLVDEDMPINVPHLKLGRDSKNGDRKFINARTSFELGKVGQRALPLPIAEVVCNVIYQKALEGYVKLTFFKDSQEKREVVTTFNPDLIRKVYGEDYDVEGVLGSCYSGDFYSDAQVERGYIRVPSIGESRHSDITRSVNFSRIAEIGYDAEPDTMFIDMDIESVCPIFISRVYELAENRGLDELESISEAMREQEVTKYNIPADPFKFESWLQERLMIEGTGIKRKLAMFMMVNASWFPSYSEGIVSASEVGTSNGWADDSAMNIGLAL